MNLICFLSEDLRLNCIKLSMIWAMWNNIRRIISSSTSQMERFLTSLVPQCWERDQYPSSSPVLLSHSYYSTSIRNPWWLAAYHSTISLLILHPHHLCHQSPSGNSSNFIKDFGSQLTSFSLPQILPLPWITLLSLHSPMPRP